MANFQKKTWAVINALKKKLETTPSYPTLGHFYREIELLKFPYLQRASNPAYQSKHGRNIFKGQQYDTIVSYCRQQKWISLIAGSNNHYTVSSLIYKKPADKGMTEFLVRSLVDRLPEIDITEDKVKVEIALDPKLNWTVRLDKGNAYLTVC